MSAVWFERLCNINGVLWPVDPDRTEQDVDWDGTLVAALRSQICETRAHCKAMNQESCGCTA